VTAPEIPLWKSLPGGSIIDKMPFAQEGEPDE